MGFQDPKYETDSGQIFLARLTDDEAAQAGAPPTGANTLDMHVYSSGSRRRFGVHARGVVLARTVGSPGDTAEKYNFLTVLTATALATTTYDVGATITIGTTAWEVKRRVKELIV